MKLNTASAEYFMHLPSTSQLFKKPANALYFLGRATNHNPPADRNDGSFLSKAPRNTAPKGGSMMMGQTEYNNTCHMCNTEGHKISSCELYNNLRNIG